MINIGITLLALSLAVLSGNGLSQEQEEVNVYAAYLNTAYINKHFSDRRFSNKPFTMIVISNLTSGFDHPFSYRVAIAQLSPKPEKDTVEDFLTRNDGDYPKSSLTDATMKVIGRYPLNSHIKFKLPHVLISDAEIGRLFRKGEWEDFCARYPTSRGIVRLSRVGFNKNKTQALLYFAGQYAPAAGEGYLILLGKTSSEWKIITQVTVWIS